MDAARHGGEPEDEAQHLLPQPELPDLRHELVIVTDDGLLAGVLRVGAGAPLLTAGGDGHDGDGEAVNNNSYSL